MTLVLDPRSLERRLLDVVDDVVVAADDKGRMVYVNAAGLTAFGAEPDELLGRRMHELLAPTASTRELDEIAQAIVDGRPWTGTVTGRRVDGSTFPHRVTITPLLEDDGTMAGMVGVGRDITVEVAASAMARAHDERFRRVFDQSPVAMGIFDIDLRIQRTNAALDRLLGYTADELVGQTLEMITHPDDVSEDLEGVRRLFSGHVASHQIQKRFIAKGGRIVVARVTGTLVRDTDGEPLYGVGTIEDLTATLDAFTTIQEQKERLAMTLEAAGVATWDLDFATMRQAVSDNYADLLGLPFDQVPETFDEVVAMVHPDDRHLFLEPNPDEGAVDAFDVEFRMVRPDHRTIWVGCKGSFVRGDDGELTGIRGTMVNLTEQRQVEIRRVEAEERYRQTIEAAHDAFVGMDAEGDIAEWNAAAEKMFGWRADEIVGRPMLDTLVPADRRERYAEGLAGWDEKVRAGEPLPERWEMTALHRDGHHVPIEMSIVSGLGEDGRQVRAFVRDISARRAHERRLAERAVTDALTGLPDRSVLMRSLAGGLARLEDRHGAVGVLFIDVDRFKSVNDELGHEAGDQLLVSVAQRLRSAVRPADTVARLGGDEFAVVCTDLGGMGDAQLVAERILTALEAPLPLGAMEHEVRVSIGIAVSLDPSDEPEVMLRHADEAMYRAKKAGGHRFAC